MFIRFIVGRNKKKKTLEVHEIDKTRMEGQKVKTGATGLEMRFSHQEAFPPSKSI